MRPSASALVPLRPRPRGAAYKLPRMYRDRVDRKEKLPQQLTLTSKGGNKNFYKGTRQAYVPGGGAYRTGPPGAWMPKKGGIKGETNNHYRLDDTKVRYYVGPDPYKETEVSRVLCGWWPS